MQIGYIGLGKMGYNMCLRLLDKGYNLSAYNRTFTKAQELSKKGAVACESIKYLVQKLDSPRIIWIMVPNSSVQSVVEELSNLLQPKDTIIDGGNTYYKDTINRHNYLINKGINYLDVGVSGGPSGALNGASLMVGGNKKVFEKYEALFKDLSCENGYAYLGSTGAGHFTKMVHNGIEYGMMQSIAEGFDILKNSPIELDLNNVLQVYKNGSVIESRLISWLKQSYEEYGDNLNGVLGTAKHSGEGLYTVKTAKELGINAKVIEESLKARIYSEKNPNYQAQIIQALREQFGGHSKD